ncbi:MAG: DegV family protein [Anaerolineaceae bacterium]
MLKIVTDSTCDLPEEIIKAYDITVIPCYINFPEKSYLDGVEISRKEFYEKLPNYNPPPTTSAPAIGTFMKVYKELLEKGASAILSIHISPVLSGIYNVAVLAAEAMESALIKTFDAGQLSLGTGLVVEAAAKAAQEGKSIDEVLEFIRDMAKRTYTFAAVNTLTYLQRSGRVSQIKAKLGSLLQIKPVIQMNQGKIETTSARTLKGSMNYLLEILRSLGPLEQLALVHSNSPDRAMMLFSESKQYFPDPQHYYTTDITPVLGSHLGPGVFGFVAVTE